MVNRLVSVGDDFNLPGAVNVLEDNLPANLAEAALNATFVPKWKATTAYLAGDKVLSPSGDVVSADVNFTSGASYNAANWNLSETYATPAQAAAPAVETMAATTPFAVPPLDTMPPTVTISNNQALDGTPNAASLITDRKTNAPGWYTTVAPNDLSKQRYFAPSALLYDAGAPNPDTWSIDFSHGGVVGSSFSHEIQIRGGQIIQYMLKQKAGAAFRIMVNGKYLTSTAVTLGGSAGSLAFITIDFGAPILAPVNLTFEAVNTRFYSVIQQNATTVTKVPGPDPKKILFAGDSYWQSSGLVTALTSMTKTAGWLMGYRNIINSSIGGSGYIALGNQGQPALGGRVTADIVNQTPDVVVVGMGHNDTPSSNAAIQAAAQSAVQAIRDGLPNAKIIVTGPMFSTPDPGVYTAMQAAIFAGVSTVSGIITVDTVSGPWITPANQAKYVSSDATHLIQIGHDYFGHRLAAAIATATRVTF